MDQIYVPRRGVSSAANFADSFLLSQAVQTSGKPLAMENEVWRRWLLIQSNETKIGVLRNSYEFVVIFDRQLQ